MNPLQAISMSNAGLAGGAEPRGDQARRRGKMVIGRDGGDDEAVDVVRLAGRRA